MMGLTLSADTRVILTCVSLALANMFSGYDTASAAAVISDPNFIAEFNFSPAMSGAFAVLINVGNCLAYLGPMIYLNRHFGRKVTMTIGNFTLMTGAALVAGARNEGMLLFGRVLCGTGVSLCQGSFAGWAAEIASAKTRGACVCIVQVSYNFGVFVAFWISLGTRQLPGTYAWRTIIALQVAFGLALLVVTYFAPESPRMLLSLARDPLNDQDAKVVKARSNLASIRCLRPNDPALISEWVDLQTAASIQRSTKHEYSFQRLLTSRSVWHRFAIGAGSCVIAQLTGVAALMLYGITVFESLGLGGTQLSLITNGVSGSVQLAACFFAVFFVDRMGRRRVMLTGLIVTCTGYLFMGALFERWPEATNRGAGIWLVICIFAIQCAYAGAMGPIAYLIGTEIWPQPLRELGISISFLCLFLAVIVINQIWPVLTESIRFRLYWIMLGINLISLALVYAFWPETKGRTLEQMDSLFGEVDVIAKVNTQNPEDGALHIHTAGDEETDIGMHDVKKKPMLGGAEAQKSDTV